MRHNTSFCSRYLAFIPDEDESMDTSTSEDAGASAPPTTRLRGAKSALTPLLPEVSAYLQLLILLYLLDKKSASKAVDCAENLVAKLVVQNRRTLDHLAARVYYHYAMAHEATDSKGRDAAKIRAFLQARLRTSTLRNDFEGQAVLVNCLLRSYIRQNLFDQVGKKALNPLVDCR